MSFKLFVDDVRPCPTGWVLARNYDEACRYLATNNCDMISLDHDLGEVKTGVDIVYFMVDNAHYPKRVTLHTANPVGRKNMFQTLLRHGPYRIINSTELVQV
jgi:hypothetical protein